MPSFSIEAPGEASPLTEGLLVKCLTSAASSDPSQIQTGTKQLQQWEKSSGYYKHLQSAYLNGQLPIEIRYLAVIQLKNGIDKYWRKTATNAVSKQDKDGIRSRLFEGALNEPDNRLAVQSALVIAKIARFEYPNDWPDVLSSLTSILRSQLQPLQLARTLLVLLHIVKELSTGRLQRTRQNMQAATPGIVHVLGNMYATTVSSWQSASPQEAEVPMQQTLLMLKVLRRLLVSGYEKPNRDSNVATFWNLTQEHLATFIQQANSSNANATLIEKHMLQLAKLHHDMAKDHPAAFALLPNSLDLIGAYWGLTKTFGEGFGSKEAVTSAVSASIGTDGDADDDRSSTEKLALKGLLIVRACVKMVHVPASTFKYRTPEDKDEKGRATDLLKQSLLHDAFVRELMETLVTRFFVFRASDLREWEEEPGEWEKREEGDGEDWEFSVRSCSEKLFLDLAINYKETLVQPLLQVFYSVASPDNEDVLFKDSVYTAIGLSAPVLHDQLDFDAFIRDVLVADVQKQTPGFNIIRRRAAILLGQWISVRVAGPSRPAVYQIFEHLLNQDEKLNDQVVRVTAGRQFKNICDDWEFQAEQFLPHAETTLTRVMHLIDEVELSETKMALLNTISVAVERLDQKISPFAERIVSMLPPLWEASEEEHLMKQAILTILARLVNAMKAESLPLHPMVFPIIQGAVEPGSETAVYLLEDALDLWAAILAQTPAPASPALLALIPNLYPLYDHGADSLRKALEITESYLLLAPAHMLSSPTRESLFAALAALLGTLRPDANGLVTNLAELTIRTASHLGGPDAVTDTTHALITANFLPQILLAVHASHASHAFTGPNAPPTPVDPLVQTDYLSILGRIALASPLAFLSAVHATATQHAHSSDALLAELLREWIGHADNIGDPSGRKLLALALTRLLGSDAAGALLGELQGLLSVWTAVIVEMSEGCEDVNGQSDLWADCLVMEGAVGPGADGEMEGEAPEEGRRRRLTRSDEVHTVALPGCVKEGFGGVVRARGGWEAFWELVGRDVDREVWEAFWVLGIVS